MINVKELTKEYLEDLKVSSVLDLGCGTGDKSLRFARKGINVVGVDNKDVQINQENFKFIKQDVREFEFKEKFGLIIASLVLHLLKKEKAIEIIKKIKENTNKEGYNFLICMTNLDDCAKEKPDNFYPTSEDLKELYNGWEIIKQIQDFTDWEEHSNLKRHRHNLLFFLVKKTI